MHKAIEAFLVIRDKDAQFKEEFHKYQGDLLPSLDNEPTSKLSDPIQIPG
jgi:hypothetical protein